MFLEQINRRLISFAASVEANRSKPRKKPTMTTTTNEAQPEPVVRAKPSTPMRAAPAPGTAKTIGVQVDAALYEKPMALKNAEGLKTMKEAAVVAMLRGVGGGR